MTSTVGNIYLECACLSIGQVYHHGYETFFNVSKDEVIMISL